MPVQFPVEIQRYEYNEAALHDNSREQNGDSMQTRF